MSAPEEEPQVLDGQLHELASVAKSTHLESYDRQKSAEVRKNAVIGVMFVISTTAQIYLGIKVISFVGVRNATPIEGVSNPVF